MSGCVRCGLPENYAGIKLDEHGAVSYTHLTLPTTERV